MLFLMPNQQRKSTESKILKNVLKDICCFVSLSALTLLVGCHFSSTESLPETLEEEQPTERHQQWRVIISRAVHNESDLDFMYN